MGSSPAHPLILRVHRFGLGPLERYNLMPRSHRGHPVDDLSPGQLYEGIRGAVFAGRLARHDLAELKGKEEIAAAKDYLLSQVRIQMLAIELVKRAMPGSPLDIRDMDWLRERDRKDRQLSMQD